jgi:hypothetical protein
MDLMLWLRGSGCHERKSHHRGTGGREQDFQVRVHVNLSFNAFALVN